MMSENQVEEFSLEEQVFWCVRKIEQKLQNKNLNNKEAKSLLQSLKILGNENTPLIKKRQIMHLKCGDYRVAMREEMKSFKKGMKNKVTFVENLKKGRCLQKRNKMERNELNEESELPVFLFNFPTENKEFN